MPISLVTIIGKSKSGKTTLLEKLIPALRGKGYRVGTVKHHAHAGFEIDQPGKDSWRHAQAGSQHVIVAAPDKVASYRLVEREWTLDEVLSLFDDVDIILAEGYKRANKPSIEIVRTETGLELIGTPEQQIAVVTDADLDTPVPRLAIDDIQGLATLIEERFLR